MNIIIQIYKKINVLKKSLCLLNHSNRTTLGHATESTCPAASRPAKIALRSSKSTKHATLDVWSSSNNVTLLKMKRSRFSSQLFPVLSFSSPWR